MTHTAYFNSTNTKHIVCTNMANEEVGKEKSTGEQPIRGKRNAPDCFESTSLKKCSAIPPKGD